MRLHLASTLFMAALCASLVAEEAPRPKGLAERYLELAQRRQKNLDRLDAYIQRGVFPLNLDFPGERVPYFVDEKAPPAPSRTSSRRTAWRTSSPRWSRPTTTSASRT